MITLVQEEVLTEQATLCLWSMAELALLLWLLFRNRHIRLHLLLDYELLLFGSSLLGHSLLGCRRFTFAKLFEESLLIGVGLLLCFLF